MQLIQIIKIIANAKFSAAHTIFKSGLREMAPMKAGEAGRRWRLRFGDYFILLHFFALPAEHFGSLTDALRSRLPKGVIASALLSITMTDQGERERMQKRDSFSPSLSSVPIEDCMLHNNDETCY